MVSSATPLQFETWPEVEVSQHKSELEVLKDIKFLNEIPNNWPNHLLTTNLYETIQSC